jgi:hypothetical protein
VPALDSGRNAEPENVRPSAEGAADPGDGSGAAEKPELARGGSVEPRARHDPAPAVLPLHSDAVARDRDAGRGGRRRRGRWRLRRRRGLWRWWRPGGRWSRRRWRRRRAHIDAAGHAGMKGALVLERACGRERVPVRSTRVHVPGGEDTRRRGGGVVRDSVVIPPADRAARSDGGHPGHELVRRDHSHQSVGRGAGPRLRGCRRADEDGRRAHRTHRGEGA